jgi:hypothetical protein
MGQERPEREGVASHSLPGAATKLPRIGPRAAARRRQNGDAERESAAMFAALMQKFRRWIGYRPERRYMRGGAR